MERLTHERLNGIRDGYWSPNKKQELVDRLAAYENTNLDPEQVKHVKETAKKYLLEKAQGKVGGWIPVEERLPAKGEEVLITTDVGLIATGCIHCCEWMTDAEPDYPIAWRPLPEPYRERSNTDGHNKGTASGIPE